MSPAESVKIFEVLDPGASRLVYGGIAVFSAVSIVLGYLNSSEDALLVAIWVVGFGVMLPLLSHIVSAPVMRATLCWMVIGMVGTFQIYVVAAVFPRSPLRDAFGPVAPLSCGLRLIFDIDECANRFAPNVTRNAAWQPDGPDRLWLTQDGVAKSGFVYLQFGKEVTRGTSRTVADGLLAEGWAIPDAGSGGESVKNVPATNEVRFFNAEDESAARTLAADLSPLTGTPVEVRDFSRLYGLVPLGQLEIWLAETRPPGIDG